MAFNGQQIYTGSVFLSVAAAGLSTLLASLICRAIYNIYFHPLSSVPGPRAWAASRLPFARALLRGTIVHDFQRLHEQYGPVLRVAPGEVTFASEEAWADIFHVGADGQPFPKDPIWWQRKPGQPQSILSADFHEHARIRKILAPAFSGRALKAQEAIVVRYVDLLVQKLQDMSQAQGNVPTSYMDIDVTSWFNFLTFDIFGDLGFGESFDCLQTSKYHPWIAVIFKSIKTTSILSAARFYPLFRGLLEKSIPASLKRTKLLHLQMIVEKVNRRLNWELERPDIMSYVIGGGPKKDAGDKLSTGEIYATFLPLTTAGSETTATVLSGTVNYLVATPDKVGLLTDEIRQRFQKDDEITFDSLRQLKYLNAVINEGLRLCPPVPWILPRQVPAGGRKVSGYWLPGNTSVSVQAYTMHRRSDYFHDASSFMPERWLEEAIVNPESPFFHDRRQAVQSFSTGPRNCLGQNLAWAEMRLALAKLLWNFDLESAPGSQVRWEDLRTFLLVEKKPILVRFKPRK